MVVAVEKPPSAQDGASSRGPSRLDSSQRFMTPTEEQRELNEAITALETTPLFEKCGHDFLMQIVSKASRRQLEAGEHFDIDASDAMAVVVGGTLVTQVGSGPKVVVGPGTVLNIPGMLEAAANVRSNRRGQTEDAQFDARTYSQKTNSRLPPGYEVEGYRGFPPPIYSDRTGVVTRDLLVPPSKGKDLDVWLTENQRCFFNVCPYAASVDEPSQKKSESHNRADFEDGSFYDDEIVLHLHGGAPGQLPLNGGRASQFAGGAVVFEIRLAQIEAICSARENDGIVEIFNKLMKLKKTIWKSLQKNFLTQILPGAPSEISWALADVAVPFSFDADQIMVTEGVVGDEGESLLLIESGSAMVEKQISGHEEDGILVIGRVRHGAVIGDAFLIDANIPRAASVRTKTRVDGIRLPSQDVLRILNRFPGVIAGSTLMRLQAIAFVMKERQPTNVEIIASLNLFRKFSIHVIYDIAQKGREKLYICGEAVVEEGAESAELCVILNGHLHVEVHGLGRVATIREGFSFGESRMLGLSTKAKATVRVASPFVNVLHIPNQAVLDVVEANPEAQVWLEELKQAPVEGRVQGMGFGLVRIFKRCKIDFVDILKAGAFNLRFLAGQTLVVEEVKEDDPAMCMITGGQIVVERAGKVVAELTVGSTFGELKLLGITDTNAATIRALTCCQVQAIPRSAFLSACEKFPEEKEAFIRCTNNPREEYGKAQWPCMKRLSEEFVNLLILYQDEWECPKGIEIKKLQEGRAAFLLVRGNLAAIDADGNEEILKPITCHNIAALVGVQGTRDQRRRYIPRTTCELYVLSPEVWYRVCAEFPEQQDFSDLELRKFCAGVAREKLGLPHDVSTEFLRMSALFRAASSTFCEYFATRTEPRIYARGTEIIDVSLTGDCMFFWLAGIAESQEEDERERHVVTGGQVYGESVLLGLTKTYPSRLQAKTMCVVEVVRRKDLEESCAKMRKERELFRSAQEESEIITSEYLQECLKRSPAFADVIHDFVVLLCRIVSIKFFAPGEVLLRQGDPCRIGHTDIMILCCGQVQAEGSDGVLYGTIKKGDTIGEVGAFGVTKQRTATTRAKQGSLVACAVLHGVIVATALRKFPNTVHAIVELFRKRESTNTQIHNQRVLWLQKTVVPALEQSALLSGCPREFLGHIAAHLHENVYSSGRVISECGQQSSSMLLIVRGSAELLSRTGEKLGIIYEGTAFGEVAALGLLPVRMATIRALTACRVIEVQERAISAALKTYGDGILEEGFARLIDSRRDQVLCGHPLTCLSVNAPINNIAVRTVALVSERIILLPDEVLRPLNDSNPVGFHINVLSLGRAKVEMKANAEGDQEDIYQTVLWLQQGSLLLEGMLAEFDSRIRAETYCECYRTRGIEFMMAISAQQSKGAKGAKKAGNEWFWRFKLLMKESTESMHARLECMRGLFDGQARIQADADILGWKATRAQKILRARELRVELREGRGSSERLPPLKGKSSPNKGVKAYPRTALPRLSNDASPELGAVGGLHGSRSEPQLLRSSLRNGATTPDEEEEDHPLVRPGSVARSVESERRAQSAGRSLPPSRERDSAWPPIVTS